MNRKAIIEARLSEQFSPLHLEVVDETGNHNVPGDAQSHFKVTLVSEQFLNMPLVKRHRLVNQALAEELAGGIHALALHTLTPEQWFARNGRSPESPPCLGGGRAS
jgi:BolA protein